MNSFAVYPNPSEGIFTLSWTGVTNASIQVSDLPRKLILSSDVEAENNRYTMDMTTSESGVYFVKIQVED